MAKTITISDELEKLIVDFCDDELNYHINESGYAAEYDGEIKAQIELLKLLGYDTMASDYMKDYETYLYDNGFGTNEDGTPWYDWWNDVDYYLLDQDSAFREMVYDFRRKYGLPTGLNDQLADRLSYQIGKYVLDNADALGIEPDGTITEFADERILPTVIDPNAEFWNLYEE